jgi:hypothetical protein
MAVILVPPIVPLSQHWTHERVVSEVRTTFNELDNERVWDLTLRHHVNRALSQLVELLNISNDPFYGEVWDCNLDTDPATRTGLPYTISLAQYIGRLWKIRELYLQWYGNCAHVTVQKIAGLTTDLNTQWFKSVAWVQQGNQLLVHVGKLLVPPSQEFDSGIASPQEYPVTATSLFKLYVYRNPQLDDYSNSPTTGFQKFVDLPDRHVNLLVMLAGKMLLEQLGKQVPVEVEATIQQLSGGINNAVPQEQQFNTLKASTPQY